MNQHLRGTSLVLALAAAALSASALASPLGTGAAQARDEPLAPHAFFSPLGARAQAALSGVSIGYYQAHQSYQEFSAGAVADTEKGTLNGAELLLRSQGAHWGSALALRCAQGEVHYRGSVENTLTGQITPYQTRTPSKQLDMRYTLSWGFSPMAHVALIPGASVGARIWWRGQNRAPGFRELYRQPYWAGDLRIQYTAGRLAIGVNAGAGRTFDATMNASILAGTFDLGPGPWRTYGLYAHYRLSRSVSLYARLSHFRVSYARSGRHYVNGGPGYWQEPSSLTEQNTFSAGVKIRF